ncbi:MAG: iron ABC transporter permease, partial [Dysgonamonadaceae bacterium]|nr:iron ABC transporter permease [Dysgonamonadaceae bacterium]
VLWSMGSFSSIQMAQMPFYSMGLLIGITGSLLLIKPLNALLLGEKYAANLGVNVRNARLWVLLVTGWLTAMVTAFCGPVGFIGLAVPHIARMISGTANQQRLLPATLLLGASIGLLCNLLTLIPFGQGLLPLNAVTPFFGAPVIIYYICTNKQAFTR